MWAMVTFVTGLVLIGLGMAFLFVYRYMKYKVILDIYEQVGGSFLSFGRQAREVINKVSDQNGKRKTYLLLRVPFKGIKRIPLPDSSKFIPHGTIITTKKKLNLLFTNKVFVPLHIENNSPEVLSYSLEDLPRVLDSWDADYAENLETHKAKPGFWDKYQQFITILSVLGMTMVFWILIFVITRQGIGGGAQLIA